MTNLVFMNGEFVPAADVKISLYDYGWLYGDGIFEGMRVYNKRVFRLTQHLERLLRSARAVRIPLGLSLDELREIVFELCRRNHVVDGYVRLVVTRGIGPLGLNPSACEAPTVMCMLSEIRVYEADVVRTGIRAITSVTRRIPGDALSPQVKSLNYQNNALARLEATDAGMAEAIMLDAAGHVLEGATDNLFIVSRGVLRTPHMSMGLLGGVTRSVVMELAIRAGWPVEEGLLSRYDLYTADECFLTGTASEVVPVVMVDRRVIGRGSMGPRTAELVTRYQRTVQQEGEAYDEQS